MPSYPASPRPAASANSPAALLLGVGDIWRGAAYLLARPGLWLWALIPFVINVAFFTLLAWLTWHFADGWIDRHFFTADQGFWAGLLGWLISVLFWILFGLIVFFLFVPIAALIASPFNDILSEKVERLYLGQSVEQGFSLKALARGVAVGLHSSIRLSLMSLGLLALALPLNFIPGIGSLLWTAASAAITIRFLSLQFTAYSMDRRLYTYQQRQEFLRRNRARTIGLGLMAFFIMLIPVLNALFIPVSAVAGTLLFCDGRLE